jgi:hypothetical protein
MKQLRKLRRGLEESKAGGSVVAIVLQSLQMSLDVLFSSFKNM